jgi:FkbM family methyltransferase
MNTTTLQDGTKVFCITKPEAKVLDSHIDGYFKHNISVKDGDVVFDVGANIGIFGIRVCQKYPNIKVFAFEPIPFTFAALKANSEQFTPRFIPFCIGIGEKEGEFEFSYYPNSPALSTSHSDVWDQNPDDLKQATHSQMKNLPGMFRFMKYMPRFVSSIVTYTMRMNKKIIRCKVVSLSHIIEEQKVDIINLLKVDCEGAEYDVFLGIKSEHWERIEKVVAEVYDLDGRLKKIQDLLHSKGFINIFTEEDEVVKGANLYNIYATKI